MIRDNSSDVVLGDYGAGAYGPTILLILPSTTAARWLQGVFADLAISVDEKAVRLETSPQVRLANMAGLELRTAIVKPTRHLVRANLGDFVWTCVNTEWETASQLMQPFVDGEHGHQYLTSESEDDALIEISYGEPHAHVPT